MVSSFTLKFLFHLAFVLVDGRKYVTMESSSRVTHDGAVKTQQDSTEVFSQDPGTIFAPLESDPVITIHFS